MTKLKFSSTKVPVLVIGDAGCPRNFLGAGVFDSIHLRKLAYEDVNYIIELLRIAGSKEGKRGNERKGGKKR